MLATLYRCTKCNKELPDDGFYKDKSERRTMCKQCMIDNLFIHAAKYKLAMRVLDYNNTPKLFTVKNLNNLINRMYNAGLLVRGVVGAYSYTRTDVSRYDSYPSRVNKCKVHIVDLSLDGKIIACACGMVYNDSEFVTMLPNDTSKLCKNCLHGIIRKYESSKFYDKYINATRTG